MGSRVEVPQKLRPQLFHELHTGRLGKRRRWAGILERLANSSVKFSVKMATKLPPGQSLVEYIIPKLHGEFMI